MQGPGTQCSAKIPPSLPTERTVHLLGARWETNTAAAAALPPVAGAGVTRVLTVDDATAYGTHPRFSR